MHNSRNKVLQQQRNEMHVYTDGFLLYFNLADSGLYSVQTSEKVSPASPLSFPLFPFFYRLYKVENVCPIIPNNCPTPYPIICRNSRSIVQQQKCQQQQKQQQTAPNPPPARPRTMNDIAVQTGVKIFPVNQPCGLLALENFVPTY